MKTHRSDPSAEWGTGLWGAGTSSFTTFLSRFDPALLPTTALAAQGTTGQVPAVPHGTTIVSLVCEGGVVIAGDRRATMGNVIASNRMEKIYPADRYSAIGIAGSAGLAMELVRLFEVELEHYEKIEGEPLSLDGKANRLAAMIRGNLGMAMQGLAVVPLFVGYDQQRDRGRIFSYDVAGGRYEEPDHHAVGSGSMFARGSLKKLFKPGLPADRAVHLAIEALFDAAEEDSATGGPDAVRRIWPLAAVVSASGYAPVPEAEVTAAADEIMDRRRREGGERA